jgi:hypothetical protein
MPIAKAISIPSDIDDNDDDIVEMGSVICAPVSLPANNTQGYWKVHHPNQWPAISLALDYFKMRLIRYNPFAENETLRTYALSAFEDAFQDHQPFQIQIGMIETVRAGGSIAVCKCTDLGQYAAHRGRRIVSWQFQVSSSEGNHQALQTR